MSVLSPTSRLLLPAAINNPLANINLDTAWLPQDGSQMLFVACDQVFEALYEGTRGPGKTNGLLLCFCSRVGLGLGPYWRGIIFRKTFPELKDIIAKSEQFINTAFGKRAVFNRGMSTWRWDTGEQLIFSQFERESDYWKYHGHEYPFIGWEELTTHATLTGYKRMFSCARASVRDIPGAKIRLPVMVRATTNPYGVGHNLVKERFRLPGHRGVVFDAPVDDDDPKSKTLTRLAIYGHISENKILLSSDPDYMDRAAAAAKNKAELKAWVDGDWDITSGGMFDDIWQNTTHCIDAFDIPDNWRIDRAFDWGSSRPFDVQWWAESNGEDVRLRDGSVMSTVRGDLFLIHQWYGWTGKPNEGLNLTNSEITRGIIERELGWGIHGRVKVGPADSAIFDEASGATANTNTSIATEMKKPVFINGKSYSGVVWEPCSKGKGSRKNGWQVVRQRLKDALPTGRGPREKAGMFVFRENVQWLRTVPSLPRSDKDLDDVDTDVEDHSGDATRYKATKKRAVLQVGGR